MSYRKVDELELQLAELQRAHKQSVRRFRVAFTMLGVAAVACLTLTGAAFQQIGRFQKSIQVDDANSRVRAVLYADDNQNKSGLEIRDPMGRTRVALHTNLNDDPFMQFFDANGKMRVNVGIGENGDAYFELRDRQGNPRHHLIAQ